MSARGWRRWRYRLLHRVPYLGRKLLGLRGRELWELVLAQCMLLWAQALVRLRPVGRLATMEGTAADRLAGEVSPTGELAEAKRLALALSRAASFGVGRPRCLARSVALHRLLELHGIRGSRIRIGVTTQGGTFAAHAWVEYRGEVLADFPWYVRNFSELSDMHVVRSA